jgi:hypothetical protein
MSSSVRTQGALLDLADQLCCEYAGALPPGQIMALVFRANHLVSHQPPADVDVRRTTVETVVRHLLTERVATTRRAHLPVQPVA